MPPFDDSDREYLLSAISKVGIDDLDKLKDFLQTSKQTGKNMAFKSNKKSNRFAKSDVKYLTFCRLFLTEADDDKYKIRIVPANNANFSMQKDFPLERWLELCSLFFFGYFSFNGNLYPNEDKGNLYIEENHSDTLARLGEGRMGKMPELTQVGREEAIKKAIAALQSLLKEDKGSKKAFTASVGELPSEDDDDSELLPF